MSTTPQSPTDVEQQATEPLSPQVVEPDTQVTPQGEPAADDRVDDENDDENDDDETDGQDEQDAAQVDGSSSDRSSRRASRTEDLVREGEVAADFLEALLDIADLAGDLEVDVDGSRAAVAIVDSEDGAAPKRLVGPGGQVLDALQELTRLAVQAETGERSWLMLDVAGYRSDRKSQLVQTARAAIEKVKESGERYELDPMTAFERKVVHDEVLAAGLHSESDGTEPSRYVVILPSA